MLLGMLVPGALVAVGLGLLIAGFTQSSTLLLAIGGGLLLFGTFAILNLLYWLQLPRLAYERGELLVYLRGKDPIRVPIEIVEVFFLGQGSSPLPRQRGQETETTNIVVRLAESATEWKQRDVDLRLGLWCESYITIQGAWCEPIGEPQMARLNQRLIEAHREQKRERQAQGAS